MTLKRQPDRNDDEFSDKKMKTEEEEEEEFSADIYYSLGLILMNKVEVTHLHMSENRHIKDLSFEAMTIADDIQSQVSVIDNTINFLYGSSLVSIDAALTTLLESTTLDKEQEFEFLLSFFKSFHADEKVYDILRNNKDTGDTIQRLLMVDVRFARFLPLSRMLYLEEIHSSHLSEEEIHKSSASDPEPFVDLTGSSIPSVQSPLNIYSQESNYGETQLTASQITAMYILPGPSISSSSQNDNLIHEMTDEEVLTEDIKSLPPDFNELSLPDLKEAVKKYGFKASSNRSEMIKVLETIWQSVHNTPSNSQILSEVDDIDLLRMEEDEIESTIKNKIIEHLKSKPLLWQKILKYEAVDLDECCEGTDFKKADIKAVLGGFNVMIKSKKETRAI